MIYLLFPLNALGAALANSFIKIYRQRIDNTHIKDNLYYILMIIVALLFFGALSGFNLAVSPITLIYAFLYALIAYLSVTFNMRALEKAELVTVSVFVTSGSILWGSLWGMIFFKEQMSVTKILGVIAAVTAVLIPYFAERKKGQFNAKGFKYCFGLFFVSGFAQLIVKFHSVADNASPWSVFCFYTNLILVPFIFLILRKQFTLKDFASGVTSLPKKYIFLVAGALLLNQAVTFSGMFLIEKVELIIYSLTEKSFAIIATGIVSKILFKEKITVPKLISIILLTTTVAISNI